MQYCSNCGQASLVHRDATETHCLGCGQQFWNNPKATVAVIFMHHGKLLFAKRGIEPNKGKYDFPGGFLIFGERPEDGAVREIKEETGVTIAAADLRLLAAFAAQYDHDTSVVDLVYLASSWQGDFKAADDVAALEWRPLAFIDDPDFVPPYGGLADKLRAIDA